MFRAHPVFLKPLSDIFFVKNILDVLLMFHPDYHCSALLVFDFRVVGCRLLDRAEREEVFLSVHGVFEMKSCLYWGF